MKIDKSARSQSNNGKPEQHHQLRHPINPTPNKRRYKHTTSTNKLASPKDSSTDSHRLSRNGSGLTASEVGCRVAEKGTAHEETRWLGGRLEAGDRLGT